MKKVVLVCLLVAVMAAPAFAAQSIVGSKHDLSKTGAGTTSDYSEVCVFCHTPHNANNDYTTYNPLWNRAIGAINVTNTYNNSTFSARATTKAAQVEATDLTLCLTCHDGNAYGNVLNPSNLAGGQPGSWTNGATMPTTAVLDMDFGNDHPIGFDYPTAATADGTDNLKASVTINGVNPFASSGTMMCATCHDVHDSTYNFINTTMSGSALCLACHVK